MRFDTALETVTRASLLSFAASAVGTPSIMCTSPESSAATRAGALVMMRKVTLSQLCWAS